MYTIKEASHRTGVPVATLRAWERRYGIVAPRRTESGYRLYDEHAIAAITAMRYLVEDGWSPATAAAAVAKDGPESVLGRATRVPAAGTTGGGGSSRPEDGMWRTAREPTGTPALPEGPALTDEFLTAASAVDVALVESVLDRAFALGSFEQVMDGWLMPTLRALGAAWAEGDVDVSGEHAASYAVMRRLGQLFAAASSLADGPRVLVGLPGGCRHELGALAFAVAVRRRGIIVVYVGSDLPVDSWQRAVQAFPTDVAVLGVPTSEDTAKAAETARALREAQPGLVIAAGGSCAGELDEDVVRLPDAIADAARSVEQLAR
jgi:DNA-binding transcriptional MerR regulator/methylmalonyl-CoA mutase cobalamin-binding subunit